MSKLITKDRLVSGGVGAAALGIEYTLWQHFHRPAQGHARRDHEEHADNDRGEYGHHEKHHHRKEH